MFVVMKCYCYRVFVLLLFLGWISFVQSKPCERLWPNENVKLSCTLPSFTSVLTQTHNNSNDCSHSQPIGTIAKYECHDYYIPIDEFKYQEVQVQNQLKCENNGTWSSLLHFNAFECVEDCGRRKINSKPLIINGKAADQAQWPWHVNLYRKVYQNVNGSRRFKNYSYICGGSLVRASVVLTAAHCVAVGPVGALDPMEFLFAFGLQTQDFNLKGLPEGVQLMSVKKIFIHDGYDPSKEYQADIALIQLENKIQFNDKISPVCLPNDDVIELESISPGMFGEVVGFGKDETGNYSNVLKSGRLKVKSRDECFRSLGVRLPESKICAGTLQDSGKWTSVCNGDSGGGFVFPSPLMEKYYVNGIVSFGNPPKEEAETECQNNAVFTRVSSYFQWIRSVANHIHGSIIPELLGNELTPFIRKGNHKVHNGRIEFPVIDRGLENKITSIELFHLKVESLRFLETLRHAKRIQTINLTDISLTSQFEGRVHLPYIKTFVLDIAIPEYEQPESRNIFSPDNHPDYHIPTTNSRSRLLKSMLFFNKDYEEELNIAQIVQLQIHLQITYKFIKLLVVNHVEGRITLTSIPETNDILGNIPVVEPQFQLQHLSIGGCLKLNLTELIKHGRRRLDNLASIQLNYIHELIGQDGLTDLILKTCFLKSLTIIMSKVRTEKNEQHVKKETIYISQLPRTLEHLSLSKVHLKTSVWQHDSRIIFPGKTNMVSVVENLQTFSCYECNFSDRALQQFSSIFKNLKRLEIHVNQTLNLTTIVTGLEHLEYVYIGNSEDEERELISMYLGLAETFGHHYNFNDIKGGAAFSRGAPNDSWLFIPDSNTSFYYRALTYNADKLSEFYTSFSECEIDRGRFKPHEIIAVETGKYIFNGSQEESSYRTLENFPDISILASYIQTLDISYVQLHPTLFTQYMRNLQDSSELKEINLQYVTLFDEFSESLSLSPQLSKFCLNIASHDEVSEGFEIGVGDDDPALDKLKFELLIPFNITKHLFPFNNNNNETPQIQHFELIYLDNTIYKYNVANQLMIISFVNFVDEILFGLDMDTTLTSSHGTKIDKLFLCHSLYNMSNIPGDLTSLHIDGPLVKSPQDLYSLIKRLTNLTQLSLRLPFFPLPNTNQTSSEEQFEPTTIINLQDIHSTNLKYLGLSQVIISNVIDAAVVVANKSLPQFTSLQILAVESIFVLPVPTHQFWNVFPVTKFGIFISQYGVKSLYETMFVSALKNSQLKWMLFNTSPSWSDLNVNSSSHEDTAAAADDDDDDDDDDDNVVLTEKLKEIKSILGAEIFELWSKKYYTSNEERYKDIFEIERSSQNGSWRIVTNKEKYLHDKLKVLGPTGVFRGCYINNIIEYKF